MKTFQLQQKKTIFLKDPMEFFVQWAILPEQNSTVKRENKYRY